MNRTLQNRAVWLLWLVSLLGLAVALMCPITNRFLRVGTVVLLCASWFGLIGLLWRRFAVRVVLLGLTLLGAVCLAVPGRRTVDTNRLRGGYVDALRRYEGVTYVWGGEGPTGIDCSGLVRRAMIDALFSTGARTLDPGLVRRAISLWWHDCTAKALGERRGCLTTDVLEAASINQLDHAGVFPGDLAVTRNGVHVMAYLGDQTWIEADPGIGHVVVVSVPVADNFWFRFPVRIVRWSILESAAQR